jgi:hypothetical protein
MASIKQADKAISVLLNSVRHVSLPVDSKIHIGYGLNVDILRQIAVSNIDLGPESQVCHVYCRAPGENFLQGILRHSLFGAYGMVNASVLALKLNLESTVPDLLEASEPDGLVMETVIASQQTRLCKTLAFLGGTLLGDSKIFITKEEYEALPPNHY